MKFSAAKLLAALLCVILAAVPLVLMGVVAGHGDHHDCVDDDCVVCGCVQHAGRALRLVGGALPLTVAALALAAICAGLPRGCACVFAPLSPVGMRVRLNN